MANFVATVSSSNCKTAEEAVTALKTLIDAVVNTQLNLGFGIIPIEGQKYVAWVCSTAA
jgi:hypothetical protein